MTYNLLYMSIWPETGKITKIESALITWNKFKYLLKPMENPEATSSLLDKAGSALVLGHCRS